MDICYIIIIIILVLLFVGYFINTSDHFATDLESIANIASIYNTNKMKVTNLDVTNDTKTFNLRALSNITADSLDVRYFNLLPRGIIALWAGEPWELPSGWLLCNGQYGTPDLRARFVVGYGQGVGLSNYGMNAKGGEESVTLTTAQMPAHSHSHNFYNAGLHHHGHWNEGQIMANGTPVLNSQTNNTGGSQAHENRPPYYALAYIMRDV
jgi:microcystin-dependent protein